MTMSHIPRFSSLSTETDVDRSQRQREKLMGLYWSQREKTLVIVSVAAAVDVCDCIGLSGSRCL